MSRMLADEPRAGARNVTMRHCPGPIAVYRFIAVFIVCLLVLFAAELLQPVQDHVILPFTAGVAHVSVWIMQLFDGNVIAHDNDILDARTGGGIQIVAGCNGVEAVLILVSAILAFPAPWKNKLVGVVLGFLAVQTLNLARIISLYYLHRWSAVWFDWFHLYLWQALIILDALVFWLVWLRWLPRQSALVPARST
jgi:exosortase H (IPTLxxWG-CTERM-specific)